MQYTIISYLIQNIFKVRIVLQKRYVLLKIQLQDGRRRESKSIKTLIHPLCPALDVMKCTLKAHRPRPLFDFAWRSTTKTEPALANQTRSVTYNQNQRYQNKINEDLTPVLSRTEDSLSAALMLAVSCERELSSESMTTGCACAVICVPDTPAPRDIPSQSLRVSLPHNNAESVCIYRPVIDVCKYRKGRFRCQYFCYSLIQRTSPKCAV